jgi:hypothetical protein
MHKRTDLASGMVNHDRLLIELIEPPDSPPLVAVSWPSAATIVTPTAYPGVAAAVTRILAGIGNCPRGPESAAEAVTPVREETPREESPGRFAIPPQAVRL